MRFRKVILQDYTLAPSNSLSNSPSNFFEDLKKLVSTATVLIGPNWDLPFQISLDASNTAIGAVLVQEEDKKPYAIYYINKSLSPVELNYTITEK